MNAIKFYALIFYLLHLSIYSAFSDEFSVKIINFYNNHISTAKADTCKMHPRCSEYAKQALSSNDFFTALMIITDRLYRSDHDSSRYQKIWVNGRLKLYDPIPGVDRYSTRQVEDYSSNERIPCHNLEDCSKFYDATLDDAIRQFRYAVRLQEVGRYDDAFWEYERILIYYPSSPFSKCAKINAFMCLYDDGEYLRAIHYANTERKSSALDSASAEFYAFWVAASYARLKNAKKAIEQLQSYEFTGDFVDRKQMLLAYSRAVQDEWVTAGKVFSDVAPASAYKQRAENAKKVCEDQIRYSPKKPVLAGSLALIPGLGYLYSGYPQSAISAAVLSGLFGWAAVEAAEDGNEPLAVAVGLIGVGWYMGNIYGSVNAALMSNEEHSRRTLLELDLGFRF